MITVSPTERRSGRQFAALLEDGRTPPHHDLAPLVALATSLRPAPLHPSEAFRAELRARLVEQVSASAPSRGTPVPTPRPARRADAEPPRRHRARQAVAAATAIALVSSVGAAAASTHALPGDPLYGVKRGIESAQLSLAGSDLARGRELLEQADHRLDEAERLAASEHARDGATQARITEALTEMRSAVQAGSGALTSSYRDTGEAEPMRILDRFVVDQRERLTDLLDLLDPRSREQAQPVADLLDSLHEQVGAVTQGASAAGMPPTLLSAGGDGWAVSRLAGPPAAGLTAAAPAPVRDAAAGASVGGQATGSPTSSTEAAGRGLVGGLTGTVKGTLGSGSTSGSSGGGGGVGLPSVSVPGLLPGGGSSPSPTSSPTPSSDSPLPLPTEIKVCVPPLTSC